MRNRVTKRMKDKNSKKRGANRVRKRDRDCGREAKWVRKKGNKSEKNKRGEERKSGTKQM